MNVQGRDCAFTLILGSRLMSLPYSTETLREAPRLITREALLDGTRGDAIPGSVETAGCVVTSLSISTAPYLLALALGAEEDPEWVSETRSLYRHRLTQRYGRDGARCAVIQDRVFRVRYFLGLRRAGYQLRGAAGDRLYLRLDLQSEAGSEDADYYLAARPPAEEAFRFDQGTLIVNGQAVPGFYAFSLTVNAEGSGAGAELRLHSTLNAQAAALLDKPRIDQVDLRFTLVNSFYEDRRPGYFRISARDLLLQADESAVDAADEVIGSRRYIVNGDLADEVYTADGERLLP